jgi:hypothetical protein
MPINQSIQFSKYFSYKNEIKKIYISQFQFLSDFDKKKCINFSRIKYSVKEMIMRKNVWVVVFIGNNKH